MIKSPLISIIIPTYNRAHIIGETLDSIIAQTYTNWECIVVDDGSSDNTAEVMAKYIAKDSRFRYYNRPKERLKGPCSCRNYGFEKSSGAYVNFFDSDDVYKPQAFETLLFYASSEIDAIIGKIELVKFSTGTIVRQNNTESDNYIEDHFLGNISFYVCGPLWNRAFLQKQEMLFDESLLNGDDWDFSMRMLYEKPVLKFIDDVIISYRAHENSLSKERTKLNKKELKPYFENQLMHYQIIKSLPNINKTLLKKYILKIQLGYLRWAIDQKALVQFFLLKRVLVTSLNLGFYLRFLSVILGYFSYKYFRRGYRIFSV